MRPTIAKIYLENLRHNLKTIRTKIKSPAKMCVAIKADAYGHGAVQCAKVALECGVDYFAVSIINEGIQLREAGIKCPILVLSLCSPDEMDALVENDLTPLVFDEEYITGIAVSCLRLGKKDFPVHLAVDTGMGRIGCLPEESAFYAKMIEDTKVLQLGGMCTHFAVGDSLDADDIEYTKMQFERFLFATEQVKKLGIDPGIRHCANSALTLNNPEMHLDMCRPGIICYGYYPGDLTCEYFSKKDEAGAAIEAVIANNSYAPEFVIVKEQVVATLASAYILHLDELKRNLEKNDSKKVNQELKKIEPYKKSEELKDFFEKSKNQTSAHNPLTDYTVLDVDGMSVECKTGLISGMKNAVRHVMQLQNEVERLTEENERLKKQSKIHSKNHSHSNGWER